jgi:hypothetical protein
MDLASAAQESGIVDDVMRNVLRYGQQQCSPVRHLHDRLHRNNDPRR